MKMTRILAAVVNTRELTLYDQAGEKITIPQGDARLRQILDIIMPQLTQQGWAEVAIENPTQKNDYAEFEKEGSGAVKFFRIAKAKLKELFAAEPYVVQDIRPVLPLSIGRVPPSAPTNGPIIRELTEIEKTLVGIPAGTRVATVLHSAQTEPEPDYIQVMRDQQDMIADTLGTAPQAKEETVAQLVAVEDNAELVRMTSAVDQIIAHAQPVSHPDFHEEGVAKQGNIVEENGDTSNCTIDSHHATDTIIAVVDNKVIPGVERIKSQFGHAAKLGSTAGVENFLKRLGAVIHDRSHSVDDLLKFMERGDLPIADDGTIIIYKVLKRKGDRSNGRFVDCHTQKVEQFTGAYVCMDENLIDPNRRNECSTGLHVARRGYVKSFSGDVCVLAKVAPEDVIAVPPGEANKMRVKGYHILMELSDKQYGLLNQNRPITDDKEGQYLLANAIAGKHVRRTHTVRITGAMGADVITDQLIYPAATATESPVAIPVGVVAPVVALENPADMHKDAPVDPRQVVKDVAQLSRKEQAKILYDALADGGQAALDAIHAFKKASKVSWEKLGLPEINGPVISLREPKAKPEQLLKGKNYAKKVKKLAKLKRKAEQLVQAKPVKEKPVKGLPTRTVNEVVLDNPGGGSFRERIHKIMGRGVITSVGEAQAIYKLKQQSRKSWTTLGVADFVVQQITELLKTETKKESNDQPS